MSSTTEPVAAVPTSVSTAEMAQQLLQKKRELEEKAVGLLNHAHEISNQVAHVTGTNLAEQPLQEIDFDAEDKKQATADGQEDANELKYIEFEKEDAQESQLRKEDHAPAPKQQQQQQQPASISAEITNLVKQMGVTEKEINEKQKYFANIDLKAEELKQQLDGGHSLTSSVSGLASSMGGKMPKKFKRALREIEKSTLGKDYGTRAPTEEEETDIQDQFKKLIASSGRTNVMREDGTRVSATSSTKERLLQKLKQKKEAAEAAAAKTDDKKKAEPPGDAQETDKKKKRKKKKKNKKTADGDPHPQQQNPSISK